jgi:DNA-binding CsgD family transcriptional regulator/tetratricopeptide (TPR) repeat protein
MTVPRRAPEVRSPLHDWRVAAESSRGAIGNAGRFEAPFVGREDLLHQFHQIVAPARAADGLVVTLTGEAGIGKSRLLRELARRATLLGLDVRWLDDPAASPSLGEVASAGRPRLVMLDAPSLDRISDLAELTVPTATTAPVVTFLALAPTIGVEGLPARKLLATLARQRLLLEIPVPPLAEPELFELTSHLLGGPPNARLHQTISSLSEGNPFLAEELALDLLRLGLVAGERGTWYLLSDVPAVYVPGRVAATLSFELDAIAPDVLQTLASAAVLGAGFRFDVLASALTSPGDQLLLHLEAGLAHGIVREAAEPPDDFQFTHELVRRVLYRRLSGVRRRRLHQAVAEALERQPSRTDRSDQSAALAYHFTRGVDRERALAYILRAQERAEHLRAWDDAIRYCREGLDLARQADDADPDLQLDLLERLGALYFGQAQTFATGACWREALHVCEQAGAAGSALRRAALAARLAALGPSWYSIEAAEAVLDHALDASAPVAPDEIAWRFDAYHELGLAYQRLGQLGDAIRYLDLARDVVDPTDWPRRALAQVSLSGVLITAGRPAEAADLLRDALDLLEAGSPEQLVQRHQINHLRDPRRTHCRALGELVRALTCLGELDEASRLLALVHDEELQFGMVGGRAQRMTAQVELAHRRPGRALQILETRMRQLATGTLSAVRVADLLLLAQAQLMHGDAALALETAAEGIRLCHRGSTCEHLAGFHVVTASALLERQAVDLALESVAQAQETIERTGANLYRTGALQVEAACRAALAGMPPDAGPRVANADPVLAPGLPFSRPGEAAHPRTSAVHDVRERGPGEGAHSANRLLTARECEVLTLMADGHTNRQIAEALVLSDKTVKRHLSNIFDKLGVNSRAAAVRSAFQAGLL